MINIRLVTLSSMLLLGIVIAATMARNLLDDSTPSAKEAPLRQTAQIDLLTLDNETVLKVVLKSFEKEPGEYRIQVSLDGAESKDEVILRGYGTYSYTHHIYPHQVREGHLAVAVTKRGERLPVSQVTYALRGSEL